MNRAEILDTAKQCVCTDRQSQYGTPEDSFNTIGRLWEDYLSAKGQRVDLKPHDVAAMMALLKIARIATGHGKADNWVDLAGYAACGGELEGLETHLTTNKGGRANEHSHYHHAHYMRDPCGPFTHKQEKMKREPEPKERPGYRYETCTVCGKRWNIAKGQKIPWYGYKCPHCTYRRKPNDENR